MSFFASVARVLLIAILASVPAAQAAARIEIISVSSEPCGGYSIGTKSLSVSASHSLGPGGLSNACVSPAITFRLRSDSQASIPVTVRNSGSFQSSGPIFPNYPGPLAFQDGGIFGIQYDYLALGDTILPETTAILVPDRTYVIWTSAWVRNTIGSAKSTITMELALCSYSITAPPATVPVRGGTFNISVTSSPLDATTPLASCAWSASSPVAWASVTPASGFGNGTVSIQVAPNIPGSQRSATLTVAGTNSSLTQTGSTSLRLFLSPSSQAGITPSFESRSVSYENIDDTSAGGRVQVSESRSLAQVNAEVLAATLGGSTGVSGQTVNFTAFAENVSIAGHSHTDAPSGEFTNSPGGPLSSTGSCVTGNAGTCSVLFKAPTNSGRYSISATIDTSILFDSVSLDVKVPQLVELPNSPGEYLKARNPDLWHFDSASYFGTTYLISALRRVASEYKARTNSSLSFNDLSLPWGGLFDVSGQWTPSHVLHRQGRSADLNRTVSASNMLILKELMGNFGLVRVKEGPIHFELIDQQPAPATLQSKTNALAASAAPLAIGVAGASVQASVSPLASASGVYQYDYALRSPQGASGNVWRWFVDLSQRSGASTADSAGLPVNGPGYRADHSLLAQSAPFATRAESATGEAPSGWTATISTAAAMSWAGGVGLPPGQQLAGFRVYSRGLPSIRSFTAEPYIDEETLSMEALGVKPPNGQPGDTARYKQDLDAALSPNFARGFTIGPASPPSPFIPALFLAAIQSYQQQSVALGWITPAAAAPLVTKLAEAATALGQANTAAARNALQSVLTDTATGRATGGITAEGFALMNYNVQYLIANLQSLSGSLAAPQIVAPANGSSLTNSIINFQWTSVSGATSYELRLIEAATPQQFRVTLQNLTSTIYTIPSGNYTMVVQACGAGGCGLPAVSNFVVRAAAIPTAAVSGMACQVTNESNQNRLTCNWNSLAGADFYFVNVVQPGAGPGGGALTVAGQQVGVPSVSLLIPNGAATVLARGCTGDGCGPLNAGVQVNPAFGNPAVPILGEPFGGSSVDSGSSAPRINFSWNRVAGDNGSNFRYRLYVQDFSRNRAALDVTTANNFYAAYFNPGTRYDALVIAIPTGGGAPRQGPANPFLTRGRVPLSPVATEPTLGSAAVRDGQGRVRVAWTPLVNQDGTVSTRKYQYFFGGPSQLSGSTTENFVDLPLGAGSWLGTIRACVGGTACVDNSDAGWGPWSNTANSEGGQASFTVP